MKERLQGHRDLKAWQFAMDFAEYTYDVCRMFPPAERWNLTSQVQRAVVSIPSNIAEGYGRHSAKELHRFVNNALGSLLEVETQIELAGRFRYITPAVAAESLRRSTRLKQLLKGLRNWAEKEPGGWVDSGTPRDVGSGNASVGSPLPNCQSQSRHTTYQLSQQQPSGWRSEIRNTRYDIRKKDL